MPRPKLHSDEAILDAASAVLKRSGPSDFTLKAVSDEVGISRAALIQRFENKANLQLALMERSVNLTRQFLEGIPVDRSLGGLEAFLEKLVSILGAGIGFETNLLIFWQEVRDPDLMRLSLQRFLLIEEAIAQRVPGDFSLAPQDAANHLHCVLSGSAMQWLVSREGRLDEYVRMRLKRTLDALNRFKTGAH